VREVHDDKEPQGIKEQGFIARDQSPVEFPKLTVGRLCPVCKGTTYVIRADQGMELEEPLTPAVVLCDNPLCPHTARGVRTIRSLGFPHNNFNHSVTLPAGKITAVKEK
jgi:hypothetical protein